MCLVAMNDEEWQFLIKMSHNKREQVKRFEISTEKNQNASKQSFLPKEFSPTPAEKRPLDPPPPPPHASTTLVAAAICLPPTPPHAKINSHKNSPHPCFARENEKADKGTIYKNVAKQCFLSSLNNGSSALFMPKFKTISFAASFLRISHKQHAK